MKFLLTLIWLAQVAAEQRTVDIVTPVAAKDASVYRFNLRHALKHVKNLRNVYVVCRPSEQMKAIVAQANSLFTMKGAQEVILVDEAVFPFTFDTIRAYLREHRPAEGYDGAPFDGTVVVPPICSVGGAKQGTKDWVHKCRQPLLNETVNGAGLEVSTVQGKAKVQSFDRTGWILQQFLKLGCTSELVPGIGKAYLVVDADTIFYQDYSPIPPDSDVAYNYLPGDARDCGNPPYYMSLDAMGIEASTNRANVCAGNPVRKCSAKLLCPIAHGMVYSRQVLTSFHAHMEGTVRDGKGNKVAWWQAMLLTIPSWHTSPFSEYITYFSYAMQHFPETVRIYGADQMEASEEEIPPNYYMSNGLGVTARCNMQSFAGASKAQRPTHVAATGYCLAAGKRHDTCQHYDETKHNGKPCPAPKYEAYHGFRNNIPSQIHAVFLEYDLAYAEEHAEAMSQVKVVTNKAAPEEARLAAGKGAGRTRNSGTAASAAAEKHEVLESALTALDAAIGGKR